MGFGPQFADLDGDGIKDVVSGSYMPGDIYVFRGLGKGHFAPGEKLLGTDGKPARAGFASAVTTWDWNRDGRTDLLVGNIEGDVWFLLNETKDGKVRFGPRKQVQDQSGTEVTVRGDAGPLVTLWDSDAIPDLIVGSSDGSVVLYRGSGTEGVPQLLPAKQLIPARHPEDHGEVLQTADPMTGELRMPTLTRPGIRTKVAVHDWNEDGLADLLVGDAYSATGPEPTLTPAQSKQRDDLQAQHDLLSDKSTDRYMEARQRAQQEMNDSHRGESADEAEAWISARVQHLLGKDVQYQALVHESEAVWKQLEPLVQKHSMHGFVWVYLRTPASAAEESHLAQSTDNAATTRLATVVVAVVAKETGDPVQDARVTMVPRERAGGFSSRHVNRSRGTVTESLKADDHGVVEFSAAAGAYSIHVMGNDGTAGSGEQEVADVTAGERREITIAVPTKDDLVFWGRLMAQEDGSPLANIPVLLVSSQSSTSSVGNRPPVRMWTSETLAETTTNVEGYFEVSVASWKAPHLRIEARGYAPTFVVPSRGHQDRSNCKQVLLQRASSARFKIVDPFGSGIPEADVRLHIDGFELCEWTGGELMSRVPDMNRNCETASDGICTITGLPPDVGMDLQVRLRGEIVRKQSGLKLKAGAIEDFELTVGGGSTLTGVVLDSNGSPVQSQEIWLQEPDSFGGTYFEAYLEEDVHAKARSNAEGRFEFQDVPPGEWRIGPAPTRNSWEPPDVEAVAALAEAIQVTSGEPSKEVVIRIHRGIYIRGKVVRPDGAVAKDCLVVLSLEDDPTCAQAQSDDDGTFVLGPLAPGTYQVTAMEGGAESECAPSEAMTAEAGSEGLVLSLRSGGQIRGHVEDAISGQRCPATFMVRPVKPMAQFWGGGFSTQTEEDGAFQHGGIIPGEYKLSAWTSDGRFGSLSAVECKPGRADANLVIRVVPGGRMKLRYEGKEGGVGFQLRQEDTYMSELEIISTGETLDIIAPSGTFVIEYGTGPNSNEKVLPVELRAGETREVVIKD